MVTQLANTARSPRLQQQESDAVAHLAAEACRIVAKTVAPVWPLADYVAVNPYRGLAGKEFLAAREHMQGFSDCELLMSVEYYHQRFKEGHFGRVELESAIDEMVEDGVEGAELLSGHGLERILKGWRPDGGDAVSADWSREAARLQSISAAYDRLTGASWTSRITEEIGKHCAGHYDRGQAVWQSPWGEQSLYAAWRSAMRYDRRMEVLGLGSVRPIVSELPNSPEAAVAEMLQASGVPAQFWQQYLLCLAYELPGWSAWTQYQTAWIEAGEARAGEDHGGDLVGLLAMRLAYDVALSKQFGFSEKFTDTLESYLSDAGTAASGGLEASENAVLRYALLRANEHGFRNRLIAQLEASYARCRDADAASGPGRSRVAGPRKLAQMAFCIDVRSERIRRHLESVNEQIATIGFAGFFGLPFAYQRLGESSDNNQLPVLVQPQFKVVETIRDDTADQQAAVIVRRGVVRTLRKAWKNFQTSSVSAFAFVEATGIFFGLKLLQRTAFGRARSADPSCDGVPKDQRSRLGPDLAALESQGLTLDRQAELAFSILRGMGLRQDFARLVVFCGHRSQTENNPLAAGLDCGACGGHSGEPNARLAAQLLNSPEVRTRLLEKGIELPAEVHFLAGVHNTTTDEISFFDLDLVPPSHRNDLEELRKAANTAANLTRSERLPMLAAKHTSDPFRRALDWSELRPEWGLTGNAAFIVAPRSLTESIDLGGRAFLHSYDHRSDPEGKVLEGILTAPMVVGSWINLQYYASTVDPRHFGSGSKTIHNVVGRFGAYSGNGGDLTTGLPWESVHDGARYQHDPVRLHCVIAAPRNQIAAILHRHGSVADLAVNGWIQLVACDDGEFFRFTPQRTWQPLNQEPFAISAGGNRC
jgi:uncharacterized protein YbcC (UPF0753/DUF2309 family)